MKILSNNYAFLQNADAGAASAGAGAVASTVVVNPQSNGSASASVPITAGGAAAASQEASSASAAVPLMTQAPAAANDDWRKGWDDGLKNDPSLAKFKDSAALAKSYTEMQKLVGQKLGIPGADATPEAKAAFYEALGVPKEPAGYEIKAEALPEALREQFDPEHAEAWAKRFKEMNVPKETASKLLSAYYEELGAEYTKMQASMSDDEFGKLAVGVYGDRAKADQAMQYANTVIEKHLPAQLRGELGKLSNTALLAVAAAISGETKALTGADVTISREGGTAGGAKTEAQLREDARNIMATPEYSNVMAKGVAAHEDAKKRVKDIYDQIESIRKSQRK